MTLWVEQGGGADQATGPLLVPVHGLGHTAEVWRPLLAALPPAAQWLVLDLPGHGRSPWTGRYAVGDLVDAVAEQLPPGRPVLAVGHSLGGVVALALAAARPADVVGAVGFGIKVAWTDDELAATRGRASRPSTVFATQDEARAAFVRFAGLDGVADPGSELAASGVAETDGGHRLAADPRTMAVDAPDMPTLLAGCAAPVLLARGEHDRMVTADQLHAVDPAAVQLPGAGHNVHVTHPHLVIDLVERVGGRPWGGGSGRTGTA